MAIFEVDTKCTIDWPTLAANNIYARPLVIAAESVAIANKRTPPIKLKHSTQFACARVSLLPKPGTSEPSD